MIPRPITCSSTLRFVVSTIKRAASPAVGNWRRFWKVLGAFFLANVFGSLIPTPNSWSDVRSQWMPAVVLAISSLSFLVATLWLYRKNKLSPVQAGILGFIFSGVFALAASGLYESFLFFQGFPPDKKWRGGSSPGPEIARVTVSTFHPDYLTSAKQDIN
jgi:heme/copper-type cytochrome/quinol oxidase subunit 3